jgi:cell division protein FtsB
LRVDAASSNLRRLGVADNSMSIGRTIKRKLRAAILPAALLSLAGYFMWQVTQGERGLNASAQRQADLRAAQAELARAEIETQAWDRRVASLRTTRLDPDALDERARAMLNLSEPNDIIVPYAPGQKLY